MLKLFRFFFLTSLILPVYAESYLNLKKLPKAENRLELTSKDFKIEVENFTDIKLKALIDKESIRWLRYDDVVLLPTARLKIRVKNLTPASYILYKDKTINFQYAKNYAYADIDISLFESHTITIKNPDTAQAAIRVKLKKPESNQVLVDYTCSRNGIKIEGLENEYFSIGCKTRRIGSFGNEKPLLEVTWMSPELRIRNTEYLPYQAAFLSNRPVRIEVENIFTKKRKIVTIKASIPKRLHRLFTAYGFGPYAFETMYTNEDDEVFKKTEPTVPALMFYINYKISETTSIRGFEAAVFKDSVFNNAGIYLGSDFGFALDNKLYFSTLIGVQYLYFKFDEDSEEVSEPIFPQGLEFMYRHAFDIPNYIISGGIFLSPSTEIDYTNVWVRWGKNYFWELNLISWGKDDFKATTYGVSLGFPFKGFL